MLSKHITLEEYSQERKQSQAGCLSPLSKGGGAGSQQYIMYS